MLLFPTPGGPVKPTVRAVTFVGYGQTYRLRIAPPPLGSESEGAAEIGEPSLRPVVVRAGAIEIHLMWHALMLGHLVDPQTPAPMSQH